MAAMMAAMAYSEAARAQQQQQKRLQPTMSRMGGEHEQSKARVRVYKFGEHLKQGHAGNGVLSTIPNTADTDIELVKGMLLRAAYGDSVDFEMLDFNTVFLYLLPDGEELTTSDLISTNDKIVIFVGSFPFDGNLMDPLSVFTRLAESDVGPPLTGQAFNEQEAQREYAGNAMKQLQSSASMAPSGIYSPSVVFSPTPDLSSPIPTSGGRPSSATGARSQPGSASSAAGAAPAAFPMMKKAAPVQGGSGISTASGGAKAGGGENRSTSAPPANRRASIGAPTESAARREGVATVAATTPISAPTPVAAPSGAGGRRLSMSGNQKLRRVVHKLVLINRFNKSAQTNAGNGTRASMSSQSQGGASGVMTASGKFKSRWGRRSIIGKTLDTYIKESNNIYSYVEQRRLAESDEKLPWYILRPDIPSRIAWDFIILGLVMYYSFLVPIKLGFELPTTPDEKAFDYFSDCIFIVDIVLNFMTTFNEDGVWVSDRNRVALKYAMSWFPLDLLASFPVGWFTDNLSNEDSSTGVNKILRMLRMFKLFRMLRMLKLFPKLFAVLETSVKIDPAVLRFFRSFLLLLMMWHLIGCAYWYVARDEYGGVAVCPNNPHRHCFVNLCLCDPTSNDPALRIILPQTDVSWYDPFNEDMFVPNPAVAGAGFDTQYGEAIMWAVSATTSIGDNIVTRDALESGFSIFIILIGLMMYSLIIGAAGSALANLDSAATAKRQVLDKIMAYMRSRKVPTFFQKIIMDYYNHVWSSPGVQDGAMLDDLPPMLRSRLQVIMNRDIIERFPIMQMMNMETYLRMVARLTQNTYLPGEYIYRQGDPGDDIFFIKRGKVDAVLPNGVTVFQTLKPGSFFGEHSMLYLTKRDASTRAVDFVDTYVLHRSDFTELYISAPEFIRELQRIDEVREKERLKGEVAFLKQAAGAKGKKGAAAAAAGSSDTVVTVKKIGEDGSTTVESKSGAGAGAGSSSSVGGSGKGGGSGSSLGGSSGAFGQRIGRFFNTAIAQVRPTSKSPAPAKSSTSAVSGASTTGNGSPRSTPAGSPAGSAISEAGHGDKVPQRSILKHPGQQARPGSTDKRRGSKGNSPTSTSPAPAPRAGAAGHLGGKAGAPAALASPARANVSAAPGEDGYEVHDDFDLFADPSIPKRPARSVPPLMRRISEGMKTLIPGVARHAEMKAAKLAAAAEANKNPYNFRQGGSMEESSDEDEEQEQVVSVVAEVPHTPRTDIPEPQGRTVSGKDRRASLRRPPTEELLRISRNTTAASSSAMKGAFPPITSDGRELLSSGGLGLALGLGGASPRGQGQGQGQPTLPGAVGLPSILDDVTGIVDPGTPAQSTTPRSSPGASPPASPAGPVVMPAMGPVPATPVAAPAPSPAPAAPASPSPSPAPGLTRLPSGPLDLSDGQLDALLEQVGGLT